MVGKADIRNPLSLLAHERSRFATCQWELLTPTDISIPLTHRLVLHTLEAGDCLFCVHTLCFLILPVNLFPCDWCITNQSGSIQIFLMHINCGNPVIFIGCIIINPTIQITAGSIQGNLVFSFRHFTASTLLIHGT